MTNNSLACLDSTPNFLGLFDTTIAPTLLYYSYIPIVIISLLFTGFIFFKSRDLPSKSLFAIAVIFAVWILNELVQWIVTESWMVHFGWQMSALLQIGLVLAVIYFVYVFLYRKAPPFALKLGAFILVMPILVALPTSLNMTTFDLIECQSYNGPIWYYIYALEILAAVFTIYLCLRKYSQASAKEERGQTIYLAIATTVLLGMFVITNIIGDATLVYEFNLIGPLGMALFIAFMSYLIVRFGAFNVKLIATQALVLGLWALVFGILFIRRIENVRYVVAATLVLLLMLGIQLIRSVKREVKQREELAVANAGQENLIHIMNHQIKGYLTKARNIFAELKSEPDYCAGEAAKPMLDEGFKSVSEGVDFVQQVLNGSNAARGTLTYTMKPLDLKTLVLDAAENQKGNAAAKSLALNVTAADGAYTTNADELQLKEAVRNLIDNSIRYTQTGSISVNLKRIGQKALLTVTDTGVGIAPDDMPKLFQKGGRGKDSLKYNVNSTGYGLAFVKGVVEAHKGRVWAESAGAGKGSTFNLELPLA